MYSLRTGAAHLLSRLRRPRLAAGLILIVCMAACGSSTDPPRLQGDVLPSVPAPPFALRDQLGETVSLSGMRGHVVALSFLYTHCKTECPVIAGKLRTVSRQLGPRSGGLVVIAISTDPFHDTRRSAQRFLREYGMADRWHFLLGPMGRLIPIWAEYHIYAGPSDSAGQVRHTAGIYLIDRQSKERVYLDASSPPSEILTDVLALEQRT